MPRAQKKRKQRSHKDSAKPQRISESETKNIIKNYQKAFRIPPNPKSHFHPFHPSTFPLFTRFAFWPSVRWPFENALWAKLVVTPWLVPPLPKPIRCLPAPSSTRSLKAEIVLKSWKEICKSCPRFAKNVPKCEFGCQGTIGAQHCSLFLFRITLLQMAQGCSIGTKSLYKQEENMNQYEIKTWCQTWSIRLTAFKG